VHATVRSFVPATRSGTVLLDDGVELPFDAAAFDAGGVRLLRVGQRVRLHVQPSSSDIDNPQAAPRIVFLTIATLPDPM
jgi:2-phospho-L-lactate/phosphoenolpyruvate guanylyltransferase